MHATSPPAPLVLGSMPSEILLSIADHLPSEKDIASLATANRHFNSLLTPYLYTHNAKHNKDNLALWWAIRHGERATAEKSLDSGADINAMPDINDDVPWRSPSPLSYLAVSSRPRNIRLLREELYRQYVDRHLALVQLLIDRGMDVEATSNYGGQTALHIAANRGDDEVVRLLIENGANIDAVCSIRNTVLHYAAMSCNVDTINLLINLGLTVNSNRETAFTPLHAAASALNEPAIRVLIDRGAKVQCISSDLNSPLLLAASHEDSGAALELLIKNGADIDYVGPFESTALHKAAALKNVTGMRLLIRYGAKTNVRDQDGNTPLHMLLRHRNFQSKLDLLQLFIDHGTNVNAPNEFGSVPLHTAASIAEVEPVKILLEHGADVNRKDDHGYVPLHLASSAVGIRKELATLLLENGADPVAQTDYGQVALVETSWRGKADNEWIRAALMKYGNGNGNSKQN
ncbi:hypothetical protein LOZ58_004207 [Ophidiomyces ophidiicola]|nr:hypothetical protein LOZ65_003687 [Ophidiomyces ophidiicola]KAI1959842.1 hypothetical protein LOZ58_004207 [Ophidiomyces ophidiicola]